MEMCPGCGKELEESEIVTVFGACKDCAEELDDDIPIADGVCRRCGEEAYELVEYEGELMCEDCLDELKDEDDMSEYIMNHAD